MKIKTKILCTLLGMASLVTLMGALAVNRQKAAAIESATTEADNVAYALSLGVISDSGQLDPAAQKIVERLHAKERRDVVLVDIHKRVLADANPKSLGKTYIEDQHDEVAATIRDGLPRRFVEISDDQPNGAKQIVAQVQSNSGQILGAVILEYGPLYEESMQATRSTIRELVVAGFGTGFLALSIAFYMGRSISKPLEQLREVATGFAAGRTDLPMPPSRKDEIGDLAVAFQFMVQKRQRAEEGLRRLHVELEARVVERTDELAQANAALHLENAERQRAEEVREDLIAILESTTDLVGTANPAGRISYLNRAGRHLLGIGMDEDITKTAIPDYVPDPAHHPILTEGIPTAVREGTWSGETVLVSRRGKKVPVSQVIIAHKTADGQLASLSTIMRDITPRKQAEVALEEAHKELVVASRQAGMAEVATNVLHNVGNVLNSVNTSIDVATKKVGQLKAAGLSRIAALLNEHAERLPAFFAEHPQGIRLPKFLIQLAEHFTTERQTVLGELASLRGNLEHINEIVAMQQSYASAGGIVEVLPVAEVIETALRLNTGSFERHGTQVACELDPALPPIAIDRNKLLLILINLVRNAKYACDEGGAADKRITVSAQLNGGGCARISVTDNGIGIPTENLTRIFEHGFTTRKTGHGFGLHSSALAATEMGGSLRVHSNGSGRGATFTIELPLTQTNS